MTMQGGGDSLRHGLVDAANGHVNARTHASGFTMMTCREGRPLQPKSSGITLPSRTIITGRPVLVWNSFRGSIPRAV
jgi:hypothetical protein